MDASDKKHLLSDSPRTVDSIGGTEARKRVPKIRSEFHRDKRTIERRVTP